MELVLKDSQSTLSVSEIIFGSAFNEALVHQVIVAYTAGARQGTSAQKNRAKVTGSNKKPWRQKGTGRARSGSIKSPIWRSGGVTFASRTRDYSQKVNKKMYRAALKSILSELVRQNRLIVFDNFCVETHKTKLLAHKLKLMALKKAMIITDRIDKNLFLAARNLYKIDVRDATHIDPVSLITFDKVIMTSNAIKQVEKMLA